MKVLVVDDEKNIRENIVEILELNGYEASSAENGKQGIGVFYEFKPDFVLCDIMMPELDGYGFLEHIKSDLNSINVPIVFLSAKAELEEHELALSKGASDFMMKPFKISDLINIIRKHT